MILSLPYYYESVRNRHIRQLKKNQNQLKSHSLYLKNAEIQQIENEKPPEEYVE
jgi:uncharacterized protein YjcR